MSEVEGIDPSQDHVHSQRRAAPRPAPSGRDVRAELGIAPDAPVIGAVGVLRAQKALARAAARGADACASAGRTCDVLIVGDGPERASWSSWRRSSASRTRSSSSGHRADVPDVLRALDVAVSCSDFEGSPLAVMEYMDAALPIVATAVGGVPDLIEDGVHGLLVRARRCAGARAAIGELLDDPERARAMGRARTRAPAHASSTSTRSCSRLEELYLQLLGRAPGPAERPTASVAEAGYPGVGARRAVRARHSRGSARLGWRPRPAGDRIHRGPKGEQHPQQLAVHHRDEEVRDEHADTARGTARARAPPCRLRRARAQMRAALSAHVRHDAMIAEEQQQPGYAHLGHDLQIGVVRDVRPFVEDQIGALERARAKRVFGRGDREVARRPRR